MDKGRDIFKDKEFDVEHALVMYAKGFVTMPALSIYEGAKIAPLLEQIRSCHIYIIGLTPKMNLVSMIQEEQDVVTHVDVAGKRYASRWTMPPDVTLKCDGRQDGWYVENAAGEKFALTETILQRRISTEHDAVGFDVLYIGQAFGEDGSRNALDRLKKHETLQKIAIKGIADGHVLTILMIGIEPSNQLVTMFNPWAKNKEESSERIKKGLDKLFGTSEAERTTLYEASLIRYFQPPFNKAFKDSFPSTNMKVLSDCYDKDFSAVVAEINHDELPFRLFSAVVPREDSHIAFHDLHTDEARRVFFA